MKESPKVFLKESMENYFLTIFVRDDQAQDANLFNNAPKPNLTVKVLEEFMKKTLVNFAKEF